MADRDRRLDAIRDRAGTGLVDVAHADCRAVRREHRARLGADAASATRDHRNPSGEITHSIPSSRS
jgi:hypothetical protein